MRVKKKSVLFLSFEADRPGGSNPWPLAPCSLFLNYFSPMLPFRVRYGFLVSKLELELIQTQIALKPTLRAGFYARALRASQNVKRAEVWVGA
jgi:hypothetical protein